MYHGITDMMFYALIPIQGKVNIVKYIQRLSEAFPTMFYMYDFYTAESEENFEEGVFWLYEGNLNTSKEELFKEE